MDTFATLPANLLFVTALVVLVCGGALSGFLNKGAPILIGALMTITLAITALLATDAQMARADHALQSAAETKYDISLVATDIKDGFDHRIDPSPSVWVIDGEARACSMDADVTIDAHPVVDYVALICDGTELPTTN